MQMPVLISLLTLIPSLCPFQAKQLADVLFLALQTLFFLIS